MLTDINLDSSLGEIFQDIDASILECEVKIKDINIMISKLK